MFAASFCGLFLLAPQKTRNVSDHHNGYRIIFFFNKKAAKEKKIPRLGFSLSISPFCQRKKKVEGFSLWGPSSVISSPQSRRSSQGFRCGRKSLEFLTTFLLRPRGRYTHSSHEKILDSFIPETKANRSSRVSLSLSPSFCKCSAISLSSCGTETTGQLAMSCRIAAWLPPSPVRAHCHPTLLFFFFAMTLSSRVIRWQCLKFFCRRALCFFFSLSYHPVLGCVSSN